jgi:hypothetical protein
MTRARAFIGCAVAVLTISLMTVSLMTAALVAAPGFAAASAAPKEPAFLQASDLPGGLTQMADPKPATTVNQFVIDPAACTQSFEADPAATGGSIVQFVVPATGTGALSESIVAYPDAKAAKAAFQHHAATARAGDTCGSVDVLTPGSTTPAATIVYTKVKVPKIGGGAYGVSRGTGDPATAAVGVELLSGTHLVVLQTFKQLPAIARRAEHLVRAGA